MTETKASTDNPEAFRRHYLAHAPSRLPGRSAEQLAALAADVYAFGVRRTADSTLVRISAPDAQTTAIDIVSPDAPFLVDSVRAELGRCGHEIDRMIHPQLVVTRGPDGRITMVHDIDDNAEVPTGAVVESWMHIEIGDVTEDEAERLRADIRRVLTDVHYAFDDAPAMYALARSLADALTDDPGSFDRETSVEAGELLRWLADGNFMILGHASYRANDLANPLSHGAGPDVQGVLRGDTTVSPLELLPAFRSGAPLVIFKSPLVSTVRKSARYDCVTVVTPGKSLHGQTVHVFLGLILSGEDTLVARVPVLRRRVAEIMLRSGVRSNSHSGRQLLAALRTLPRDELLEAPTGDLLRLAQLVVNRAEHEAVGVFARTHLNRDFVSVLVYVPAERFGPDARDTVEGIIARYWPGDVVARDDRIVELGLARMQFLVAIRAGRAMPNPDRAAVEEEIQRVTRRWGDDFGDLLTLAVGEDEGERLFRRYKAAFPEAYKEDFDAATAVRDLMRLEELPAQDGLAFDAYVPPPDDHADRRLKVFRTGTSLSLARALPIFTQMGIEVLDERPYEVEASHEGDGERAAWIYDFGLRLPSGVDLDEARTADVVEALDLLWRGEIEKDGLNALVVRTELTWWQVNVLRAYAKYLRQAGTTFSQGYIEQALVDNAHISARLVQLFEARFDPAKAGATPQVVGDNGEAIPLAEAINNDLAAVASLDQDRILRSVLTLVTATLRTNAYHPRADRTQATIALKLDPRMIPDLPQPKPRFEIWVYSPRVEGVHLRFGPIARGGLRWSDRREDFRTEILGLVKAQMVKNAVIVPVGAKGGFVAKELPDPNVDRDGWLAEGIACYKTFISCLLDLTDNYGVAADGSGSTVVPPEGTRRYDADDPYLVVAADKGTATFSDIANALAVDRGFWLGDAFASGGSNGYDHKAMGITARGAWESVKYHFRELGVNVQEQEFTVVGVGDMSGDVFGNGMLLSEHILLVAAFDHRHVFLDPDPDAAVSFAERQRIFALPRSSWADYDTSLIAGGGVYPRTLKSIPVSPQVRERLGIAADVTAMAPNELIHAILTAPVDLLWNGGIGTYVKASAESHTAVGDKANDALRADATQLRCKVVGEGGNLGFTQLGRIEFARNGGHINTDAIDNSAGVDTSDHEVNIKILLDRLVAAGRIERAERDRLLASVTDDVARHVLRTNYGQNVLLGLARWITPQLISVHRRLMATLEATGELSREIEFLPTDKELARRASAGEGLYSPESAVLLAYVKIVLTQRIDDSMLPDDPWFDHVLRGYFPPRIAEQFPDDLRTHPLAREIITTTVVNDMINRSGTSFVYRANEETGAEPSQIALAYSIVREVFDLPKLWAEIEALDNLVPVSAQHAGYHEIRRLIDRATRWLLDIRFPLTDVAGEIERFRPTIAETSPRVPDLLRGTERDSMFAEVERLVELGLPRDLALRIGELLSAYLLLDVVEIANVSRRPATEVAELHFVVSERFRVDQMLSAITDLPRSDRWSTLARAALRHDLYAALAAITSAILRSTEESLAAVDRVRAWETANAERVQRARTTVGEALSREDSDLATLSVALRVMRSLPT